MDRVLNYLDPSSESGLISSFLDEYIGKHAVTLLDMESSGLETLIKENKKDEIKLLFDLFSKVNEPMN